MKYSGIFLEMARVFRRGTNIVILEIGVDISARSTRAFLKGLGMRRKKGTLYSIDIIDYENRVKKTCGELSENWVFLHGDSKDIEWDQNRLIDILFIDGDHHYPMVKADYEKYEPFVKKGGLILLHDVTTPPKRVLGVNRLYHEIKYPKIILNFDSMGLGIITK